MDWTNAVEYCSANLNVGDGYGGYTDWRLPNRCELFSLMDAGRVNPGLPSGHPFNGVNNDWYWTGTAVANNTSHAWLVWVNNGHVENRTKVTAMYIWPVRGRP